MRNFQRVFTLGFAVSAVWVGVWVFLFCPPNRCAAKATGGVKDGVRAPWVTGAVFVTPPGWWHSHHNESGEAAWVLPTQDAGLLTYQRALDIRFAPAPAPSN